MKKKRIIICAVLLILAAAIAVLAVLNRPSATAVSGTLSITRGGETLCTLTIEEIEKLPYTEFEKEIVSSSFENESGLFRGVCLRTLMEAANIDVSDVKQYVAHASDGFVGAFPADEVAEGDSIVLVYAKNGEPLDEKTGPLRIIAAEDEFGNRCAKLIVEIELR